MVKKCFVKPYYETIRLSGGIFTASNCGCFDEFFCPTNYYNCTSDGSGCGCATNYNPASDNCAPCPSNY